MGCQDRGVKSGHRCGAGILTRPQKQNHMQTSDSHPINPASADKSSAAVHPARTDAHFDALKYTSAPMARAHFNRRTPPGPTLNTGNPNAGIQAINDAVRHNSAWVQPLRQEIGRVIVGQEQLIDRLMVGLISNGHILLEGVPGLAKTLALKTLASALSVCISAASNSRRTCCPADIVGTMIYNPRDGSFSTKHGPVFANLDPRGRNQPRAGQGAERAARSDAGTPGHARRRDAIVCPIRSSSWRRKIRSNRKAPIRCPKRRSIASC